MLTKLVLLLCSIVVCYGLSTCSTLSGALATPSPVPTVEPSATPTKFAIPTPTATPRSVIVYDIVILDESEQSGGLQMMSADGRESEQRLPVQQLAGHPEWSHSGDKILYTVRESFGEERYSFWIVAAEGHAAPHQLTSTYPFDYALYGGKWSFDDRYIAFRTSDRETDTESVVVVEADTERTTTRPFSYGYAWSPTECKLAILSGAPGWGVYVLDLRTGSEQFFAFTSDVKTANPALSWAPDGRQVVFVSSTADTRVDRITVLDISTGQYQVFAPQQDLFSRSIWALSWSPDGKYILFQGHMHQAGELTPTAMYILNVSTGVERKLVEEVETGVWSPNGREIAYLLSINVQNPNQIYKINIETGEITQLTDDPHIKMSLSWK
jgi:Tol biopolymer transport system component